MSTPSIASTALSAHHMPYAYPHHPSYQTNPPAYQPGQAAPDARVAHPYHTYAPGESLTTQTASSRYIAQARPAPHQLPTTSAHPPIPEPGRPVKGKKPDWNEYYKNGIPQEVIVIDDDTPQPPASIPQPPRGRSGRGTIRQNVPPTAGRKRKAHDGYDAREKDSPAFSAYPAKSEEKSSSRPSVSTDRTTSLHTTAPTSLGSYGSSGASNSYEDVNVGQKRKRPPPKETRAQAKRKQQEATSDAFANYIPPPKPPIKAADVHVPVVATHGSKNAKIDDDDGHFIVTPGAELTNRYTVDKLLGQGTFGKVVEAWDKKKQTRCAVKIIRSVQKYRDASRIELRVLSTLALNDKMNRNKCIHLRDSFDFRHHICIVTDLLGQSVFDFLKGNGFVPFPSTQIQNFARQLFTSVAFLHDLNLVHTDLKPENILLVNGAYQTFTYNRNIPSSSHLTSRSARQRRVLLDSDIRLIDFGSATFDDEYHSTVVSTRHYRAPEIILQLGWSFPCDIWSIGCIIVEFFTGDALFQTHDNLEHLAMMEAVCNGKIDAKLIKQVQQACRSSSSSAIKYFHRNKLDYPAQDTTRASRKYVKAMKRLFEFIPSNSAFNRQLLDLLRKIFVYDPAQRITAKQALQHAWFKETMVDDGTEALRIRHQREEDVRLTAARAQAEGPNPAGLQQATEGRQAKRMRAA